MKSTTEQLEKRGFLSKELKLDVYSLTLNEKIDLLKSKIPTDRTLAARLLKHETDVEYIIAHLITALIKEIKLYSKIEISMVLVSFGKLSVKPLIKTLGEIGANQHKVIPDKEFKKNSYPLPRDIASRILAHIGKAALPELLINLEGMTLKQQSEAIDAIGYICFYNACPEAYQILKKCYLQNATSALIKWKISRAFSAFPESKSFLDMEKQNLQNQKIGKEIERSIALIMKRN